MIEVVLRQIEKRYPGSDSPAVTDLSLCVEKGELVCLLGPSGCGKTTTLKIIAGLLEAEQGNVLFDGEDVTSVPAEERDVVMVFQNHLLFPFLSVAENVGFGLKMKGLPRDEIRRRVTPMLDRMQLAGYQDRRPSQLSGGQRQRVALARALVLQPKVLLLDEPLSNLDASLRDEMRELILSIKEELDVTIIFVTHDQEEALLLSDRVAVMFDGVLEQYGSADELYRRPKTVRVARFFGNNNILSGRLHRQGVETVVGMIPIPRELATHHNRPGDETSDGREVALLVRPEEIDLREPNVSDHLSPQEEIRLPARVLRQIYMGTHRRYIIDLAGRRWSVLDSSRSEPFIESATVTAAIPPESIWLIPL